MLSREKDIREDTKKKCVYVAGLVEKEVHSPRKQNDGTRPTRPPLVSSLALA